MSLDEEIVFGRKIAADGSHFGAGGVERVNADGQFDAGGIGLGELEMGSEIALEAGEGLGSGGDDVGVAEIDANAAFIEGAQALGGLPIHVGDGGNTRADHFEAAEEGAPVNMIASEAVFQRPNDAVEPFMQRQIVAQTAQQDHGRVTMDIGKRG